MIKILACYECNDMIIIELSISEEQSNHWLHYDSLTEEFTRLCLRHNDFTNEVSEYYFEQGFLKLRDNTAVYIEKFNFQQHTLNKVSIGKKTLGIVEIYTGKEIQTI
ncbi:hypothetical protein [Pedobacter sp. MW01-1-1]|uniref:hypothetical protein n=1 Tax=Pedobacter sp. MW01-1-1 TaxID=3383027 RepID=UPI003FF0303C